MESLFPPPDSATAAAATFLSERASSLFIRLPTARNRRRVPCFDAEDVPACYLHTESGNSRELAIARLLIHITVYHTVSAPIPLRLYKLAFSVNYKRARHLNCNRVFCDSSRGRSDRVEIARSYCRQIKLQTHVTSIHRALQKVAIA